MSRLPRNLWPIEALAAVGLAGDWAIRVVLSSAICALGRILEPRLPDLGDDDTIDYEPWHDVPDWVEDETGEAV